MTVPIVAAGTRNTRGVFEGGSSIDDKQSHLLYSAQSVLCEIHPKASLLSIYFLHLGAGRPNWTLILILPILTFTDV